VYRAEFRRNGELAPHISRGRMHRGQVLKAVVVCIGLAIAFFAGVPVAKAALIGGAILLLTRAIKPSRIYHEIDGPLLFMFAGLFVR
ncbi:anion transporter, partial [Mesorhizobium sp. M2D.F.Ca.ET.140.01.1.1]